MNQRKGNGVTSRQVDLARKLNAAGLLSGEGLEAVVAAVVGNVLEILPHTHP